MHNIPQASTKNKPPNTIYDLQYTIFQNTIYNIQHTVYKCNIQFPNTPCNTVYIRIPLAYTILKLDVP